MPFGILKIKYRQRELLQLQEKSKPLKWSALAVVPAQRVGLALLAADQSADRTLHTRNGL